RERGGRRIGRLLRRPGAGGRLRSGDRGGGGAAVPIVLPGGVVPPLLRAALRAGPLVPGALRLRCPVRGLPGPVRPLFRALVRARVGASSTSVAAVRMTWVATASGSQAVAASSSEPGSAAAPSPARTASRPGRSAGSLARQEAARPRSPSGTPDRSGSSLTT